MSLPLDQMKNAAHFWGISKAAARPDILIAGSPERTEFRVVIEDESGRLLIMERIAPKVLQHKTKIADTLSLFKRQGLPVEPYLKNVNGKHVDEVNGEFWQIVPYVHGVDLDRPNYIFDVWRGPVLSDFLCQLKEASKDIAGFDRKDVLDLPRYIDELMVPIHKRRPEVRERVHPFYLFTKEKLYPVYAQLPTSFNHGDFHALNIIWGERSIKAAIDWEFLGYKPELYDVANMLGCLGIEDPESLWGPLTKSLIQGLKDSGKFSPVSFQHLPDLVIALRFAWLSEWLRKKDEEMLEMECDYFDVLIHNRDDFAKAWGSA